MMFLRRLTIATPLLIIVQLIRSADGFHNRILHSTNHISIPPTIVFAFTVDSADDYNFYSGKNALYTQVISDVDDTLKSSGGVNVAGVALGGIDVQYARGDLYPGVAQFMLELSWHYDENSIMKDDNYNDDGSTPYVHVPPKLAILTARAEEFKAALELKSTSPLAVSLRETAAATLPQSVAKNNEENSWGIGPVLYGSVAEWIVQSRKGLRKFTNFERLLRQDPSPNQGILQYIYVGDTGELDQEAGENMLTNYPHVCRAVFLHVVSGDEIGNGDSYVPLIIPAPRFIEGRPMVYFRTYVGAAVTAIELGLMNLDGLERVRQAAIEQLKDVPLSDSKWRDLQSDIDRADVYLMG